RFSRDWSSDVCSSDLAILREAVKSIEAADERFNWVGVYVLNPEENVLWLHNYIGEPTEHAKIPVGQGVCGTAVAEAKNQNVPDESGRASWREKGGRTD